VLPDAKLLDRNVIHLRQRLDHGVRTSIESRRAGLESLQSRSVLRKPHELIHSRFRLLDELDARARRATYAKVKLGRAALATAAASLSALSPLDVLTRGYSVTLDAGGGAIDNADSVKAGDLIRTKLHRGEIESVVRKTTS
jgi:exodeoxyribonuclease VII large subunit